MLADSLSKVCCNHITNIFFLQARRKQQTVGTQPTVAPPGALTAGNLPNVAEPGTSSAGATATEDDDDEYFEEDEDVVEAGDDTGVKCCDTCKCESYTRRQLRQLAPTEGHHMLMVYMGKLLQTCRKWEKNDYN